MILLNALPVNIYAPMKREWEDEERRRGSANPLIPAMNRAKICTMAFSYENTMATMATSCKIPCSWFGPGSTACISSGDSAVSTTEATSSATTANATSRLNSSAKNVLHVWSARPYQERLPAIITTSWWSHEACIHRWHQRKEFNQREGQREWQSRILSISSKTSYT